ncbi:MAG: 4-(cytidine 5'-diphospho)-2-C-methyl-D-erythritol kinase [Candidatus Muiribacteriota bacterium]
MIIKSPAKINLALDILYKRKDGFHEIDTIMAKVNLFDEIEIMPATELDVICKDVSMENNLVTKAIRNLEKITDIKFNKKIKINKKIPQGAGLAGGSSNAGCILKYLGKEYKIDKKYLFKAGALTGADINFFIDDFSVARCLGKGEIIIPLQKKISMNLIIIKPEDIFSSTPAVYKNLKLEQNNKNINQCVLNILNEDWHNLKKNLFNVLEKPAFEYYNELGKIFAFYQGFYDNIRMSGSGSSFFILGNIEKEFFKKNLKKIKIFEAELF